MLVASKLSDWNAVVLAFVYFGYKFKIVAPLQCFCLVALCSCWGLKEILPRTSNFKNLNIMKFLILLA